MAKKNGRPSLYTPEIIDELCERLSNGEPMAAICREEGMPSHVTVWNWMNDKTDPERAAFVSESIARAREVGEDVIAAQVLEIVDQNPERVATMHGDQIDSGDVSNRRMRAEYRLKLLAKWNPKRWGEKVDLTTQGDKLEGNAVHITREVIGGK